MIAYVTPNDIKTGVRRSICKCPVAKSVLRTLKKRYKIKSLSVEVDSHYIRITYLESGLWKTPLIKFRLDNKIRDWIEAFDAKEIVNPIQINLKSTLDPSYGWANYASN